MTNISHFKGSLVNEAVSCLKETKQSIFEIFYLVNNQESIIPPWSVDLDLSPFRLSRRPYYQISKKLF